MTERVLPGELEELPYRHGGDPITPDEALGVARRHARVLAKHGRPNPNAILDELPDMDAPVVAVAFRLSPRTMAFVRAKAEMEGRKVTWIIQKALEAYAASPPGSTVSYDPPARR